MAQMMHPDTGNKVENRQSPRVIEPKPIGRTILSRQPIVKPASTVSSRINSKSPDVNLSNASREYIPQNNSFHMESSQEEQAKNSRSINRKTNQQKFSNSEPANASPALPEKNYPPEVSNLPENIQPAHREPLSLIQHSDRNSKEIIRRTLNRQNNGINSANEEPRPNQPISSDVKINKIESKLNRNFVD